MCTSTEDLVDRLRKDMLRKDFNEELGFMHEVKQEVIEAAMTRSSCDK